MARNNQKTPEEGVNIQEGRTFRQKFYAVGEGSVIAISLMAMVVLFYNPVMFLLWSIVMPKKAANMLYKLDIPVFIPAMQVLNGWVIWLFPFRMKQHFMWAHGLSNYGVRLQVRYYNAHKSAKTVNAMSAEAIDYLWKNSQKPIVDWINIAETDKQLKDSQMADLIQNNYLKHTQDLVRKWTPSAETLSRLLEACENGSEEWQEVFLFCVETYGLPQSLIDAALDSEMAEDVQTALEHFAQRTFVRNHMAALQNDSSFEDFCRKTKTICDEAQMAMNSWQYEAFHNAGHKLSTAAIESFLQKGNLDICTRIFRYEENHGLVSAKAKALINANPQLMSEWIRH